MTYLVYELQRDVAELQRNVAELQCNVASFLPEVTSIKRINLKKKNKIILPSQLSPFAMVTQCGVVW